MRSGSRQRSPRPRQRRGVAIPSAPGRSTRPPPPASRAALRSPASIGGRPTSRRHDKAVVGTDPYVALGSPNCLGGSPVARPGAGPSRRCGPTCDADPSGTPSLLAYCVLRLLTGLLRVATDLIDLPAPFELGIAGDPAGRLLDLALDLLRDVLHLVARVVAHRCSSWLCRGSRARRSVISVRVEWRFQGGPCQAPLSTPYQ